VPVTPCSPPVTLATLRQIVPALEISRVMARATTATGSPNEVINAGSGCASELPGGGGAMEGMP